MTLDPLKRTQHHHQEQFKEEEEGFQSFHGQEEQAVETHHRNQQTPKKRSYLSSPSAPSEHAQLAERMGESHHQHHYRHQQQHQLYHQQQSSSSSRMAVRGGGGGEIVEVQGGHIVRSTGRKDRHSKVCTAKGPRDRRVRLSAHTAIKFYDVQDRLGYDRPSKAVDWLIKNSRPAIDELEELPPWQPTATSNPPHHHVFDQSPEPESNPNQQQMNRGDAGKNPVEASEQAVSISVAPFGFQHLSNPSFLPPSLDSDVIADTIKSFFPTAAAAGASASTSIHFQNYPPDLLSRTSSQSQDLRLSLQSFQDPMLLHHQHQHHPMHSGEQALFSGAAPMAFDAGSNSWPEQQQQQRMIVWNAAESSGEGAGGGGYVFAAPSPMPLLGQNPFFSQRGPLQSSNSPSVRAWTEQQPLLPPQISAEHQPAPTHHHYPSASSISAIGFASGGFSGFRIPARIQGEEEHDADANKPSSASSARRH